MTYCSFISPSFCSSPRYNTIVATDSVFSVCFPELQHQGILWLKSLFVFGLIQGFLPENMFTFGLQRCTEEFLLRWQGERSSHVQSICIFFCRRIVAFCIVFTIFIEPQGLTYNQLRSGHDLRSLSFCSIHIHYVV